MATAFYGKGREGFANGAINWGSDTIKAVLVDAADYTVAIDTDDNLDDIPSGARVATATLTTKTNTLGVLDADDVTFSAVTGDPSEAIVLYKDTGTESTSRLIAYIDNFTGLPVTPNGGNIVAQWSNGGNKIGKL